MTPTERHPGVAYVPETPAYDRHRAHAEHAAAEYGYRTRDYDGGRLDEVGCWLRALEVGGGGIGKARTATRLHVLPATKAGGGNYVVGAQDPHAGTRLIGYTDHYVEVYRLDISAQVPDDIAAATIEAAVALMTTETQPAEPIRYTAEASR